MSERGSIAVYGAYGHTGRFILAQLLREGWTPIACGRDATRLHALTQTWPGLETRVATIDDAASLDRALAGTRAVINAAGPFLDTAMAVMSAAIRARIAYLDTAAEQRAAFAVFDRLGDRARDAGIIALPAIAFYGALGDLLATAAMADWLHADAIDLAVGLDSWHPTEGTRKTGRRNHWRRWYIDDGAPRVQLDPAPTRGWRFPEWLGAREAVMVNLSEIVLIARHLRCARVASYMNLAPLRDIRDEATPAPVAVDEHGRSAQRFVIEARARRGGEERRARAEGRDIYAITAPLIVAAMTRVLDCRVKGLGALAAGEALPAREFLTSLADEGLQVTFDA